jgi:hypothetical protein
MPVDVGVCVPEGEEVAVGLTLSATEGDPNPEAETVLLAAVDADAAEDWCTVPESNPVLDEKLALPDVRDDGRPLAEEFDTLREEPGAADGVPGSKLDVAE